MMHPSAWNVSLVAPRLSDWVPVFVPGGEADLILQDRNPYRQDEHRLRTDYRIRLPSRHFETRLFPHVINRKWAAWVREGVDLWQRLGVAFAIEWMIGFYLTPPIPKPCQGVPKF